MEAFQKFAHLIGSVRGRKEAAQDSLKRQTQVAPLLGVGGNLVGEVGTAVVAVARLRSQDGTRQRADFDSHGGGDADVRI